MDDLIPLAETIAARLKVRHESIAIAESSTGGLIAAALLALPGASAYFLGGAVAYTRQAKILLLGLDETELTKFRPATELHALLLAHGAKARFGASWGLGETGATGPTGNRYGDPAATLVLRLLASWSALLHLRPARPSGSPTCMRSRLPPLSFWPTPSRSSHSRPSAVQLPSEKTEATRDSNETEPNYRTRRAIRTSSARIPTMVIDGIATRTMIAMRAQHHYIAAVRDCA